MRTKMMTLTATLLLGVAVFAVKPAASASLSGTPVLAKTIDLQQQSLVTQVQGRRRARGAGRAAGRAGRGGGGRRGGGGISTGAAVGLGVLGVVGGLIAADAVSKAAAADERAVERCIDRYGDAYDPDTRIVEGPNGDFECPRR